MIVIALLIGMMIGVVMMCLFQANKEKRDV